MSRRLSKFQYGKDFIMKNLFGKEVKYADLRKEIASALCGEKIRCPQCGSYNHIKIEGLKKQHTGGDDWCQSCWRIFDGDKLDRKIY